MVNTLDYLPLEIRVMIYKEVIGSSSRDDPNPWQPLLLVNKQVHDEVRAELRESGTLSINIALLSMKNAVIERVERRSNYATLWLDKHFAREHNIQSCDPEELLMPSKGVQRFLKYARMFKTVVFKFDICKTCRVDSIEFGASELRKVVLYHHRVVPPVECTKIIEQVKSRSMMDGWLSERAHHVLHKACYEGFILVDVMEEEWMLRKRIFGKAAENNRKRAAVLATGLLHVVPYFEEMTRNPSSMGSFTYGSARPNL